MTNNFPLFISNPANIFYLTGFRSLSPYEREAFVLRTKKNTYLFTDPRHDTNLKKKRIKVRLLIQEKKLVDYLNEIIKSERIKILEFEEEDLKYAEYKYFSSKLKAKFRPLHGAIFKQREIKSIDEVRKIKKACRVADLCLKEVAKHLKVGVTEKEISLRIELYFKKKGYDISFTPIVAFDQNSAHPHYDTANGHGKLKKTSIVLIDFGAQVDGYNSDMTRMFFMKQAPKEARETYQKLLTAQKETIDKIKEFKTTKEIDHYVRQLLREEDLPNFSHSTGHGIGLEVHEKPSVSFRSKDKIENGQVFTIEPGVYYPGKWGLRIEDIVYIRNGKPELLTKSPK